MMEILTQPIPCKAAGPTGVSRCTPVWSFNPAMPDVVRVTVTEVGAKLGLSLRHLLTGTEAEVRLGAVTVFPCGMELLVRYDYRDSAVTYVFPMSAIERFIARILHTLLQLDDWDAEAGTEQAS